MADLALKIKLTADNDIGRAIGAATRDVARLGDVAESSHRKISGGVKSISEQLAGFRNLYLGLQYALPAITNSATALLGMAESYKEVNARLTNATQGAIDFANAQSRTVAIAQNTGQSLESIAGLYGKLRTNAGMAAEDAERLTEILAKATQLDGGGAGAQAALFQLQQGLASGTLRGEELNSVLEQTPTLALSIARGLDMPIGKLREYAAEGKLSAETVKQALFNQQKSLEEQFANLPVTAARAFENVKTAAIQEIGNLDDTLGLSGAFAGMVQDVADNLRAVTAVTGGALVAIAGLYAQHYASRAALEQTAHINSLRLIAERKAAEVAAARASLAGLSGGAMVSARQNLSALAVQSVAAKAALEGAAKGTSIFSGALSGLAGVFRLLTGPIGLAATAIGTLGGLMYANRGTVIALGSTHATVGETIKAGWQVTLNGVVRMFRAASDAIGLSGVRWGDLFAVVFNRTVEFAKNAVNGIIGLFVGLGDALGNTAGFIATRFRNSFTDVARQAGALFADIKAALSGDFSFSNFKSAVRAGLDGIKREWDQYTESLKGSMDKALGTDYVGKAMGKIKSVIAVQVETNRQLAADRQAEEWFNETAEAAAKLDTAAGAAVKTSKDAAAAAKAAAKAEKERLQEWERAQEAFEKGRAEAAKGAKQEAKSIAEQVKRLREQTEEYGLSAEALHALEQSRLDVAVAAAEQLEVERTLAGASNDEIEAIWDKIDALKDLKVAREEAYAKKTAVAADSAQKAAAEWKRASADIERSLTDALLRGFESGKGFAENLKDTLKNMFETLVLRPIIQPIAQAGSSMVMGMMGMGASGSAMAGGGSGIMGTLSNGLSAANLFGGGSGVLNAANGVVGFGADALGLGASLFGTGAAYTSALSGLGVGASQAAMLAAQTGSFGAAGLSATAAAAGGTGTGVASALSAIPGWGWALGALALLGGSGLFGGKPSNKAAWGSYDLGSNETFDLGNMTGDKQASQETMDARSAILESIKGYDAMISALGGTAAQQSIGVDIGERDGVQFKFDGGALQSYGSDPNAAVARLFRELADSSSGLSDTLKNLLVNFDGTAEEMLTFGVALASIQEYADADPLTAVAEAAEVAGRSAWQTWQQQGVDLRAALSAWDGSAAAAAELANLTQSRYQTELALAQQIHAALASTSAMFANTAEEMRYSTLDQAGKYDYLRDKSAELEEALKAAYDPVEIEALAQELNAVSKSAWQLLGEEERRIKIDEYEKYLGEIDAITTERLNAAGATITAEHDTALPDSITAAIEAAMDRVATEFMAAASAMQAAADTPITVDVSVDVPADVEVGYTPG